MKAKKNAASEEVRIRKIEEYSFPEDLKKMSPDEMNLLSYSIREFLIDKVSRTGGHLASNLGVVELTIALHRVFNSPVDKIIWDVGHQSYVHKILTGRCGEFDTLRQFEGLSGFPKSGESCHDAYNTGHSSTSISAAAGMAAARDISGGNNEVVAVIGDGSLTGGMAYEALNNIGYSKSKVIVILNDNGMSISPNTGGISRHLGNLRTSKGYLSAKRFIKEKVTRIPNVGRGIARSLADFKNDVKYSVIEEGGVLFEELGFTYFGPVDGHNIEELCNAMQRAKSLDEPVLIHVITKKGKGYKNAENNPGKFHGISSFNPETGELISKSSKPSYSRLFGDFMLSEGAVNDRLIAITAAMGEATGLGKFAEVYPKRFFDVGIAEEHAVSFAAGMAKSGMHPVCAIYSSFLQRAYDQIVQDVCMQNLPVTFAIDRAGVVGADGETHQGVFDLSYLSSVPNLTVLTPHDGNQLKSMMKYAVNHDGPVAVRYPRGNADYDGNIPLVPFTPGNTRIAEGSDVDIWACGKMYDTGLKVKEILENSGLSCGLVDVATVKPLDTSAISDAKMIITIEDNTVIGGFGQQLSANVKTPVKVFGWPDEFIEQGTFEQLADKYGLTAEKIAQSVMESLK